MDEKFDLEGIKQKKKKVSSKNAGSKGQGLNSSQKVSDDKGSSSRRHLRSSNTLRTPKSQAADKKSLSSDTFSEGSDLNVNPSVTNYYEEVVTKKTSNIKK